MHREAWGVAAKEVTREGKPRTELAGLPKGLRGWEKEMVHYFL